MSYSENNSRDPGKITDKPKVELITVDPSKVKVLNEGVEESKKSRVSK